MASDSEPTWLSEDEVVAIASQAIALFGGFSAGIRDRNLLKAALGRPLNKWHYEEPKPDLFALAAAYCFALVKGHVFDDGNKRIAYVVAVVFLQLNGVVCAPSQADIVQTMLAAAAGTTGEDDLAAWFRHNSRLVEPN